MGMIKGVTTYPVSIIFQPHPDAKTRTTTSLTLQLAFYLTNAPERMLRHVCVSNFHMPQYFSSLNQVNPARGRSLSYC